MLGVFTTAITCGKQEAACVMVGLKGGVHVATHHDRDELGPFLEDRLEGLKDLHGRAGCHAAGA